MIDSVSLAINIKPELHLQLNTNFDHYIFIIIMISVSSEPIPNDSPTAEIASRPSHPKRKYQAEAATMVSHEETTDSDYDSDTYTSESTRRDTRKRPNAMKTKTNRDWLGMPLAERCKILFEKHAIFEAQEKKSLRISSSRYLEEQVQLSVLSCLCKCLHLAWTLIWKGKCSVKNPIL